MVDGEITVKRYELRNEVPYLCSGNPRYAPIPLVDLECQVWGVVRSVIHEYPVWPMNPTRMGLSVMNIRASLIYAITNETLRFQSRLHDSF